MAKKMLIDATHPEETRVVVLDGNKLEDFDFESASKRQIAGNIYLAKVTRVEPSLQAAFVEYGGNRHGFLAFAEIHPDYYQIPKADREALIAEEAEAARRRAEAEAAREAEREAERAARDATGEDADDDAEEAETPEGLEIIEPVDETDAAAAEGPGTDADEDGDGDGAQPDRSGVEAAGAEDEDGRQDADAAPTAEADAPIETPSADDAADEAAPADAPSAEPETAEAAPSDAPEATPEPETAAVDADEATDAEGEDARKPDSIAEAAGTGDDETVEEDYAATSRKRDDEEAADGGAAGGDENASAPVDGGAEAVALDAAVSDAVVETRISPSAEDASEDGTDLSAAQAEATETVETPDGVAEAAPEDAPAASDAAQTDETAPRDDDPAATADAETAEAGAADASEGGEDDAAGEDDGRRRRRSRRGGRSRRSRKGRARADGEEEASEADAAQTSEGESEADGDPADADGEDAPARPRGRGRGRGRGRDRDRNGDDDEVDAEGGDDMAEAISIRRIAQRRYKIQEVIKVRQIMLVQVVKEERGNKGAALTTYLSLAGRYCVLMPNTARGGGISRKITSAADRKKLKDIAGELEVPQGMGLIVRTAGAKRSKSEIKRDYEYLLRAWAKIRDVTLKSAAPALIHEEGSLIKRVIRDMYSSDFDAIEVDGEQGWREARDYMSMLMPGHSRNVVLNRSDQPLFHKHGVEQELEQLFNPTVQLKSGGYIVIGVTEALVAIDINSGKSTKEGSIEDTALKTNLEASDEIARQLKLRDLAGLIVIDYIDMEEGRNNRAVEKRLKDRLKNDRARIQVGRISGFGLMEMSRQRLRPGMIEATTAPCSLCHGTGLVRSDASLGLTILRRLTFEASRGRAPELVVKAPLGAASFLFNEKREHLAEIEAGSGVSIRIEADPALVAPKFDIEKSKTQTRTPAAAVAEISAIDEAPPEEDVREIEPRAEPEAEVAATPEAPVPDGSDAAAVDEDDRNGARRRRGRRGGRRRRKADDAETVETPAPETPTERDGPAPAEEADDAAEATAEVPPPRKTRRRRKKTVEAGESAAAAPSASDSAPEAAASAAPDADEAAETPEEAATMVEPEAAVEDPAPPSVEEVVDAASEAETPPLDAPAAETTEDEAEAALPEATEPETPAEPKPRRRGWWSR